MADGFHLSKVWHPGAWRACRQAWHAFACSELTACCMLLRPSGEPDERTSPVTRCDLSQALTERGGPLVFHWKACANAPKTNRRGAPKSAARAHALPRVSPTRTRPETTS